MIVSKSVRNDMYCHRSARSRNPFRSSSTAEYSAVVFVAIFAVWPKF